MVPVVPYVYLMRTQIFLKLVNPSKMVTTMRSLVQPAISANQSKYSSQAMVNSNSTSWTRETPKATRYHITQVFGYPDSKLHYLI